MLSFTNDELRSALKADLGADASDVDFMPFTDLDQSVRDDVRTLRESPLIPGDIVITGFVYDVRSGRLREVR
jgi:carbonic anhydrase